MNIRQLTVAVLATLAVAGCANNGSIKPSKDPQAEVNKPKPISAVFKQHETESMTLTFDAAGELESVTIKGYATQNGNNNVSREKAKKEARLEAYGRISEFFGSDVQTKRTSKMVSKAIQNSKMNTLEGQVDGPVVVDTANYDANGDIKAENLSVPAAYPKDNINDEKVDTYYDQVVTINARNMVRGFDCKTFEVNDETRQVVAICGVSMKTIEGAKNMAVKAR